MGDNSAELPVDDRTELQVRHRRDLQVVAMLLDRVDRFMADAVSRSSKRPDAYMVKLNKGETMTFMKRFAEARI